MNKIKIFIIVILLFFGFVNSTFADDIRDFSRLKIGGVDIQYRIFELSYGYRIVFYDLETNKELKRYDKVDSFNGISLYRDNGNGTYYFKFYGKREIGVIGEDLEISKVINMSDGNIFLYNGEFTSRGIQTENTRYFSYIFGSASIRGNTVGYTESLRGENKKILRFVIYNGREWQEHLYDLLNYQLVPGYHFTYGDNFYFLKQDGEYRYFVSYNPLKREEYEIYKYQKSEVRDFKVNFLYDYGEVELLTYKNGSLDPKKDTIIIDEKLNKGVDDGNCTIKDIAFTSMFSFFEKDLTFKKIIDEEYFKSITFGERGKKYEHSISISNVENLVGFNFEDIVRKRNISFDFKNDFYRVLSGIGNFLDFYEYPRISISSTEPIEWLRIDGELPNGHKKFAHFVKCGGVGFGNDDFIDGVGIIEIGKNIKLHKPSENVCLQLNGFGIGTTSIKLDFGTTSFKFHSTKVCESDEGEIFVNGKKFDGKKEDLENGVNGFDINLEKDFKIKGNYNFDGFSDIKTDGSGILNIQNGKIKDPEILENGKCKLFNEKNLNFLYYSNGVNGLNLSFRNFSFLNNNFGGILDFGAGIIVGPVNNLIGILGVLSPFYENNQKICLFGDVKKIEFHKMFIGTNYYGQMTIFDYLVLFGFGSIIFTIVGGFSFFTSIKHPGGEYEKVNLHFKK